MLKNLVLWVKNQVLFQRTKFLCKEPSFLSETYAFYLVSRWMGNLFVHDSAWCSFWNEVVDYASYPCARGGTAIMSGSRAWFPEPGTRLKIKTWFFTLKTKFFTDHDKIPSYLLKTWSYWKRTKFFTSAERNLVLFKRTKLFDEKNLVFYTTSLYLDFNANN